MSKIHRQYNIRFVNKRIDGRNTKYATGGLYISLWLHFITMNVIDDAIDDINQCINGLSLDDSWTWDTDIILIDITPKGVRLWRDKRDSDYYDVPLHDMKSILLEYKKFHNTPPFHDARFIFF